MLTEQIEECLVVHVHQFAIERELYAREGDSQAHQPLLHQLKVHILNLLHPKTLEVWIELDFNSPLL